MLTKDEIIEKADELKNQACTMHEKVLEGIEDTMSNTAQTLDTAADKMHETADYLRHKNINNITSEIETTVKRYPLSSIMGSFFVGILISKIISR